MRGKGGVILGGGRGVDKGGGSIYTKRMNNTIRIAVLTAIALASPLAMADSGTKGKSKSDDCSVEQAFIAIPDLLIVRPISLAGCAVGFTAFVVSSPFTAMAECVDESWDTLVKTPARFTFERDLGDFDDVK
jgi:hypothetical protein